MKILVTGVTGQLGHDVLLELIKRGHQAIGSGNRKMKVVITGAGGQLGHDCVNNLLSRGHEAVGSDISRIYFGMDDSPTVARTPFILLDITDRVAVEEVITRLKPDAIIHCAAWTAVDAAEDEENRVKVDAINHFGTQYIADAAKAVNAKMLYLITHPDK